MSKTFSRLVRRTRRVPWLVAAFALLSTSAFADDAAAERADRVYVLGGATISWDLERQQFHPPTAEQAARLAEEVRLWLDAEKAGAVSRAPREIVIETLPGGVKRARLPLSLMNFAVVRGDGETAGMCAEGPVSAGRALSAAPAAPEEK